ncbi:MAG: Fructosamine/Ketosamine-3-kinase [Actinomycetia bacterium]|nr:Fructosamine/Ketosamine-3-kinase [Actinomycetes bacterium]
MITLDQAIGDALGAPVINRIAIGGGDINQAARVHLADRRVAFVKHHPDAPPGAFTAEARGLSWLAEAHAVRIPAVLAVRDEPPAFLALEWIEPGVPAPDYSERLGRGLAALHAAGAAHVGPPDAPPDVAALTWPEFYAQERLLPEIRAARSDGLLPAPVAAALERVCDRIAELCGPSEPTARLHGDLWAGNAIVDAEGGPCLVDPHAYGGDREVDLAMMRLFGGFDRDCYAAYAQAWPLAPGAVDRVALYQLYPLLRHLRLFGSAYLGSLVMAVQRYESVDSP